MKDRGLSRLTEEVFDHVEGDHGRFAWWCGECRRRYLVNAAAIAIASALAFGMCVFFYDLVDLLEKAIIR